MKYKQITVNVKHIEADLAAYAFIEAGSEGVNIVDGKEINEMICASGNWDYFDESLLAADTENAVVTGGYSCDFDENALSDVLNEYLGREVELRTAICDSADWENEWRKYYRPIDFGEVVIVPAWQKNDFGGRAVYLDPGMAFGTGNHETTGMCIKLLQLASVKDKRIFDIGCGSGILGLAALKMGAGECVFVDNDEIAVTAAKDNLKLNGYGGQSVICGDLLSGIGKKADIIIANITADILIRLRSQLQGALKTGGTIILSGIIDERLNDVIAAYENDFIMLERMREKEWNALLLKAWKIYE